MSTIIAISTNGWSVIFLRCSRKSTPFAAQLASEAAGRKAFELGMRKVDVRVKGAGGGRESAVRALKNAGLEVLSIRDVTGVPHNGCRPKKKRRI
jgi:small subunit ribosomal protein S11